MPGRQTEDQIKRTAVAAGAAMAGELVLSQPSPIRQGAVRAPDALESCLSQIDARVAQSFTPEQLRALEIMLEQRRTKRHKIDLRTGFSWGGRRYYLSLFFGRDRRTLVRKPDDLGHEALDDTASSRGRLGWLLLTLPLLLGGAYLWAGMAGVDLGLPELFGQILP